MKKSFILALVASLLILCLTIFSFYYYALRSNLNRIEGAIDKTIALYLLEAGVTVGSRAFDGHDIERGSFNLTLPLPNNRYRATFTNLFDGTSESYTINFEIDDPAPLRYIVEASVRSPRGFKNRVYHLRAAVRRPFPFFIRPGNP